MQIARVIGPVTSTLKHPMYNGRKLLLVEALTPQLQPLGRQIIAVDTVQAGQGDIVLVLREGKSTRAILGANAGPILEVIVAIVDDIALTAN